MQKTQYEHKYLNNLALIYGVVVALVNYVGFLLASSGGMPVADTENYRVWIRFIDEHNWIITVYSIISFVIPVIIIVLYRVTANEEKWKKRIINLPFVFSAIGSLGWILSFTMELICLLHVKVVYHIDISEIVVSSLLNILQECICIFTLSFLILDFVHRKFVLPSIYPDGNLDKYGEKFKPSVRFVLLIFYFSVCIFPAFFLTTTLITIMRNNKINIDVSVVTIMIFTLAFSIIILWTFGDYLSNPLRKLRQGTQRIKEGDYGYKVDIVSNDDFGELADAFNDMSASLDEKNRKIHAIQNSIIRGMAVMVESRDNSTGGHINRTSDCVKVFVDRLAQDERYAQYDDKYWKAVVKSAPMHDLGKIAVDDAVLRKPGKFTDEEFEIMKTHSSEGARIVESVLGQVEDEQFKQIAINVAHFHHEKWNGMGYPEKLSGEDIPFEARVMALADVFDALVSKRCYKDSFSYDRAFEIIKESQGTHFDPELAEIFINCRKELEELYDGYEA